MAKSPPIHRWRIVYSNGGVEVTIGYVLAPNEDTAIDRAIEKYNIDPRLAGNSLLRRQRPSRSESDDADTPTSIHVTAAAARRIANRHTPTASMHVSVTRSFLGMYPSMPQPTRQ
jgi:hypothetical protein